MYASSTTASMYVVINTCKRIDQHVSVSACMIVHQHVFMVLVVNQGLQLSSAQLIIGFVSAVCGQEMKSPWFAVGDLPLPE